MKRTRPVLPALLGALVASASLASACGVSVKPTITANAADVLGGRTTGTLVLKLQGLRGGGLVRVYVDDGSRVPYAAQSDPRYVGYTTGETNAARNVTLVITAPDVLRRAMHGGSVKLRFLNDAGDASVNSAVIDAPR